MGNLLSVLRAIEYCGAEAKIASDADSVHAASKIILPGVGAFPNAMKELEARKLIKPLKQAGQNGKSILGICLGMQLLVDESKEFCLTKGLGLIQGKCVPLPSKSIYGELLKKPHMGWSNLQYEKNRGKKINNFLNNFSSGSAAYFVHSFMVIPTNKESIVATCNFGGHAITAIVSNNNVLGCQFHPEKSGRFGLEFLKWFIFN